VVHRDINGYSKANATMEPLNIYKGHTAIVEDVQWHATKSEIFGSVGDDRKLLLCVALSSRGAC
jgi:histone-binding protein RBBP4